MLKKWFFRFSIFLVCCIIGLSVYLFVNKDAIQSKAVQGLNGVLDAKVEVNGHINLTFLSTFPNITLELQQVFIEDKVKVNDTLANLAKINFVIHPLSLFRDTISLNTIKLSDGLVKLKVYKDGKTNFNILKQKQETDSTSTVSLNLNKVLIEDVQLVYSDDNIKSYFDAYLNNAYLSGLFLNKNIGLNVKLDSKSTSFKLAETSFLNRNELEADIIFDYIKEGECFVFKNNTLNIDGNIFELDGNLCTKDNTIALKANSEGENIKNSLQLVPKDLFDLDGLSGAGEYFISVSLTDKLNKPKIKVDFALEDGDVSIEDFPLSFSKIYTTGTYSNTPRSNLVLKDFDFKINDSHIAGSLILPNLKEKQMQLTASGELQTEDINDLKLKNINLVDGGKISMEDLKFDFSYRNKDSTWIATKLLGKIDFKNIQGKFTQIGKEFTCNSNFVAKGKKIQVSNCTVTIGENDINYEGDLENALNYFQDNIFKTNEPLIINGNVHSKLFDINTFLNVADKQESKEIPDLLKWLNIRSNLDLKIETLKYKKLVITDLSSKIKSKKAGVFNINNLRAKGLKGNVKGNVELRFFNDKTLEVSLKSNLRKIDISKLFKSFDNFGQKTIQENNLKGLVSADLMLAMSFKKFTDFQTKDLLVQSDFNITKGEIINLEALKSLSKYLSVDQLEHIYFSEYKSELKIMDEVLYLQNNKIKSNVLSLDFGGSHSFDNKIDYTVKINLTNFLAAKFKKQKTLQKDYVNDVGGGINIFLSMKGDMDNPSIKMVKRKTYKDEQTVTKKPLLHKEEVKEYFKKDDPNKIEDKEFYFEDDEEEYIDFK